MTNEVGAATTRLHVDDINWFDRNEYSTGSTGSIEKEKIDGSHKKGW